MAEGESLFGRLTQQYFDGLDQRGMQYQPPGVEYYTQEQTEKLQKMMAPYWLPARHVYNFGFMELPAEQAHTMSWSQLHNIVREAQSRGFYSSNRDKPKPRRKLSRKIHLELTVRVDGDDELTFLRALETAAELQDHSVLSLGGYGYDVVVDHVRQDRRFT